MYHVSTYHPINYDSCFQFDTGNRDIVSFDDELVIKAYLQGEWKNSKVAGDIDPSDYSIEENHRIPYSKRLPPRSRLFEFKLINENGHDVIVTVYSEK